MRAAPDCRTRAVDTVELPAHAEVERALRELQLGVDASELHGALCGFLCGGGEARERGWLQQLALEPNQAIDHVTALSQLFTASGEQLQDPGMGFQLLLPDADQALGTRADAVIAWARGFLGGFGLAAGKQAPLSDESSEALQDLAAIATAALSCDDPDSDEESLTEISEFLRVTAMLLHSDCHASRPQGSRLH